MSSSPEAAVEILNNATPTTGSYSGNPVLVPGSNHVEIFVVVTAGAGTFTLSVQPIENVSGTAVGSPYTTAALTAGGTGVILLDYEGTNKTIGDSLKVSWTVVGVVSGVYVRLMKKK